MATGDRLVILPPRGRIVLAPHTDTSPEVPRTILPEDVTQPPMFIPGRPAEPVPAPGFVVHDVIGMLPREPQNAIGRALKNSLTFHWEGLAEIPLLSVDGTVLFLQAIARFHIRKDWHEGDAVVNGDGIMYHECIGQNGDSYLLRDYEDVLFHTNYATGNVQSRAILVLCSRATPPTESQLEAVRRRIAEFRRVENRRVPAYPHHFWTNTACPGPDITRVVQEQA